MTRIEAQTAVATILRDLESASGSVVESVTLVDVDVTSMSDDTQQLDRMVRIELKRLPGTRWGQAKD